MVGHKAKFKLMRHTSVSLIISQDGQPKCLIKTIHSSPSLGRNIHSLTWILSHITLVILVWLKLSTKPLAMCALTHSLETWAVCTHTMYKGIRSCSTKTCYILTHCKINLNQLYLSLSLLPCLFFLMSTSCFKIS